MKGLVQYIREVDWVLITAITLIMGAGLITNYPADGFSADSLFLKQLIFCGIGVGVLFIASASTYTVLKGPLISLVLFFVAVSVLIALLLFAPEINGAKSWFHLGPVAIQPVEFVKIILVIVLARYFAGRHIHIHHIRHVLVSLFVMVTLFLLVFKQPDLGSSIILIAIWAGMIFVSGISKKHIIALLLCTVAASLVVWQFMPEYQRDRVIAFAAPLENLQSSGYTAHQSKIAIGSGQMFGKGIGEGTQSKLGFLPLSESDFVFSSFAEEWGFVGVFLLFLLYGIVGWRLLWYAAYGRTSFETLFAVGAFVFIFAHVLLHTGVNAGIFPVTGITMPFMSYGGSHIVAETLVIAMVLGMARLRIPGGFAETRRNKVY